MSRHYFLHYWKGADAIDTIDAQMRRSTAAIGKQQIERFWNSQFDDRDSVVRNAAPLGQYGMLAKPDEVTSPEPVPGTHRYAFCFTRSDGEDLHE